MHPKKALDHAGNGDASAVPSPTTTTKAPMQPTEKLPAARGLPFEGGYYAGCLHVDGVLHALIVAPRAGGETGPIAWGKYGTTIAGAGSFFDGAANTVAMAEAGSALAKWAQSLDLGGFTDWYLPSRDELELLYRAFKPTAETNYMHRSGDNPSSVPPGYPYTEEQPAQASALAFREGNEQAFEAEWYWSSTQYSRYGAWGQGFNDGNQDNNDKSYEGRARAVRRFIP